MAGLGPWLPHSAPYQTIGGAERKRGSPGPLRHHSQASGPELCLLKLPEVTVLQAVRRSGSAEPPDSSRAPETRPHGVGSPRLLCHVSLGFISLEYPVFLSAVPSY